MQTADPPACLFTLKIILNLFKVLMFPSQEVIPSTLLSMLTQDSQCNFLLVLGRQLTWYKCNKIPKETWFGGTSRDYFKCLTSSMQPQGTKSMSVRAKTISYSNLLHKLRSTWWPFVIPDTILTTRLSLVNPAILPTTVLETKWVPANRAIRSCLLQNKTHLTMQFTLNFAQMDSSKPS